jgi:GGDEF domain-containing protein
MTSTDKKLKTDKFSLLDQTKELGDRRFYDPYFVNEYGKLEHARSERYGESFSVLIINIGKFNHGKTIPSKKELIEFLKQLVDTTLEVVRNCDVAGMMEDKNIVILLPRTDYFGALITTKKLTKALEPITTHGRPHASILVSSATYPKDANGYGELLVTATRRIEQARESFWEKDQLKNKLFWEIMATLTDGKMTEADYSNFEIGDGADFPVGYNDQINEAIIEEMARNPKKRGILYLGIKKLTNDFPAKRALTLLGSSATKMFIAGEGKSTDADVKNVTSLALSDPRITQMFFTLYLSEDSAYAFACVEAWADTQICFHTSDPYLVEGLITKFQRDCHLQEQL